MSILLDHRGTRRKERQRFMANIMIVDDDDDIRDYLQFMLSHASHKVYVAPCGEDTIAALQILHPDLLLVDIKMPKMDGYELIRQIRSTDGVIPIIAISGVNDPQAAAKVKAAGGNDFLAKPFHEEEILGCIAALLPKND